MLRFVLVSEEAHRIEVAVNDCLSKQMSDEDVVFVTQSESCDQHGEQYMISVGIWYKEK